VAALESGDPIKTFAEIAAQNVHMPMPPVKIDREIADVKRWIDHAATLAAPHLRVFAGPVPQGVPEEEARRNAAVKDAMRETGVRRIVFSSTAATYGEPAPHEVPIVESLAQRPVNPYGASKLCVEELLRAEAAETARGDALGAVALRYFNVAGADPHGRVGEDHRPETHIVPICLEVALGKRPHLTVFGDDYATPDGTCVRDYVHVADLVSAHLASLSVLAPGSFRCWNVGIGRGYSVREVVESVRRVTGHPIPLVMGARRAGDPASLFANADAIRRDLGWQPRYTDLDEIIATAWRWHRAHPDGYR
jgi:UDP-glucose 4-epimerase